MRPHILTASICLTTCFQTAYSYKTAIRYDELVNELNLRGLGVPTGSGVSVTQVEAPEAPAEFLPQISAGEFSGKTITDQTGGGNTSSHATSVGKNLYGNTTSIAPGINTIDAYEANDWLSNWGSGTPPVESNPLQNHSWVGFTGSNATTIRMDFAVNRDGFLPISGLYNSDFGDQNIPSDIPEIYNSIYNGISVGVSDGTHRTGVTSITDGLGRVKPEIVAPNSFTSFSTPYVTATAALLIEAAGANSDAKRQQTLKAILLAAADKSPFVGWDQTSARPIDDVYGAGQLDAFESYFIQQAGRQAASSTIDERGWNFTNLGSGESHSYFVSIPSGFELRNLSMLITWNREVSKTGPLFSSSIADLSLTLTDDFDSSVVHSSDSPVDNIEHIWRDSTNGLSDGNYTFTVLTDNAVAYAIAWRSELFQDFALWSTTAFTPATPIDERDPTDDPDKDGIENLLEQAFGGDPETNDLSILPLSETIEDNGATYLQISFRHPTFENDLTYTVETVTELNGIWSSQTSDVELIEIEPAVSDFERYTYRRVDPVSAHEKAFLRVSVTQ